MDKRKFFSLILTHFLDVHFLIPYLEKKINKKDEQYTTEINIYIHVEYTVKFDKILPLKF